MIVLRLRMSRGSELHTDGMWHMRELRVAFLVADGITNAAALILHWMLSGRSPATLPWPAMMFEVMLANF